VLDGRDIGTVVCPNANFKLFITASPEVRAERRFKELQDRGEKAIRSAILQDIVDRDERDRTRLVSPLVPAKDAHILETSTLDLDAVFKLAINYIS
jgi:cytidylate kinase